MRSGVYRGGEHVLNEVQAEAKTWGLIFGFARARRENLPHWPSGFVSTLYPAVRNRAAQARQQ
jgi:hypothetical protein